MFSDVRCGPITNMTITPSNEFSKSKNKRVTSDPVTANHLLHFIYFFFLSENSKQNGVYLLFIITFIKLISEIFQFVNIILKVISLVFWIEKNYEFD